MARGSAPYDGRGVGAGQFGRVGQSARARVGAAGAQLGGTMSDFNARLARLADAVRALDGGADLARDLIVLAGEVDASLEQRIRARDAGGMDLVQAWTE